MSVEGYRDYLRRVEVSGAVSSAWRLQSQVEERAAKNKTLAGAGAEFDPVEGYAVSRDGVITFELDPAALGARLKFVLTPLMKDGQLTWNCRAFPEAAARRFAPADCRSPD